MNSYDLLVITGPTASGKTSLAATVAHHIDGEVISADSRQVYRGMDIGSGKDYDDYIVSGKKVPCHLIDITDAGTKYNLFEYQRDFLKVYDEIRRKGHFPVVCGGSGMYIDSIVSAYSLAEVPPDYELRKKLESKSLEELSAILASMKKLHNKTDTDNRKRAIRAIEIEKFYADKNISRTSFPRLNVLITAIKYELSQRRIRISERLKYRLENGMIEEVKKLISSGVNRDTLIYYGLEYKYVTLYLSGELSYTEMFTALETAIHQFAKRQMTWFRGMERRGITINWIDGNLSINEKVQAILGMLQRL